MTEASQAVSIKLSFDQPISATDAVADDFVLLINGKEPDAATVKLDVTPSAEGVAFTLRPAA